MNGQTKIRVTAMHECYSFNVFNSLYHFIFQTNFPLSLSLSLSNSLSLILSLSLSLSLSPLLSYSLTLCLSSSFFFILFLLRVILPRSLITLYYFFSFPLRFRSTFLILSSFQVILFDGTRQLISCPDGPSLSLGLLLKECLIEESCA